MYIENTGSDLFSIQDLTSDNLKTIQQSIIFFKETAYRGVGLLPHEREFLNKLANSIEVEVDFNNCILKEKNG